MNRRFGRARVAAVLGALIGLLGPSDTVWAEDAPAVERAHHARATRTKKRARGSSERSRQNDDSTSDVEESAPESESTVDEPEASEPSMGDDEVVTDPELRNGPPTPTSKRTDGQDEVFSDPELDGAGPQRSHDHEEDHGWGAVYQSPSTHGNEPEPHAEDEHDPLANTGTSRLVAWGQFGADLHHEGNLEDAYETRLRFDAEVEFRRSRRVRLSIGVRTDLLWAMPAGSDKDLTVAHNKQLTHDSTPLQQSRFELDILPLSAYVDVTPANGFHLRLGEQQVSIARMDFYSPNDMLAAFDMRGQIGLGQATGKLAQPAVRVDWDLSSWATLEVVYLPWFMPNLVRPNRDRFVARELGTSGASLPANLDHLIAPGNQTTANGQAIRFIGPQPDFTKPQAQARMNMRGRGFEVAVTGGSALEKLPSIYVTPDLEQYIKKGDTAAFNDLAAQQSVIDASYHRYEQAGIDGSFDLAPLTLGFELAFSPSRHLVAATRDAMHLPQPNVSAPIKDYQPADPGSNTPLVPSNVTDKSIRKGVPLVQGALHVDWIKGETFAVAIEGFFVQALKLPYDTTRDWWGFVPGKGLYAGGILGGTYRPDPNNGRWRFDASVVGLIGPSIIFMPQVEYHLLDTLYVNVGAQLFEGPIPKDAQGHVITGGVQSLNVGGLFSGYDQAYFGFRYVP